MMQSEVHDQDKMFEAAWNEANAEPEAVDAPILKPDQSDPFALGWSDGEKYASADMAQKIRGFSDTVSDVSNSIGSFSKGRTRADVMNHADHKAMRDAGAETIEDAYPERAAQMAAEKEARENAPKPAGQTGLSTRSPASERDKRAELARKGITKKTDQDQYLRNPQK